tara:strand:+ start:143 stop:301 length:159 start_codon:yes stop_codon:yes gene_type:complete
MTKQELLDLIFVLIADVSPNGFGGLTSEQEDRAQKIDEEICALFGEDPSYLG